MPNVVYSFGQRKLSTNGSYKQMELDLYCETLQRIEDSHFASLINICLVILFDNNPFKHFAVSLIERRQTT